MSKSMIGLDPLAWLSPNADDEKNKTKKKTSSKKKASSQKTSKKKVSSKKEVIKKSSANKKVVKKGIVKKKVTSKKKVELKVVEKEVEEVIEAKAKPVEELTEIIEVANIESETEETPVLDSVIKLNSAQDISQAAELHKQVIALINDSDIIFDGGEVERIDAASLQVLTATFRQAEKYGSKVSWQAPSDALKKSAELLGLTEILNL